MNKVIQWMVPTSLLAIELCELYVFYEALIVCIFEMR